MQILGHPLIHRVLLIIQRERLRKRKRSENVSMLQSAVQLNVQRNGSMSIKPTYTKMPVISLAHLNYKMWETRLINDNANNGKQVVT